MLTAFKRNWLLGAGIVLGLVVIALAIASFQDVERTQYIAPDPPVATTSSSSSTSTPTPTPSRPPVSITPPARLQDPAGGDKPVSVAVKRGGTYVVKPVSIGPATSLSAKQVWSPEPHMSEWYQPDGYAKPGMLSAKKAVIAGHVTYSRKPDVFFDLKNVKKGDTVIVTYASKKTYVFTVHTIIIGNKEALRSNQNIWGIGTPSRSTVLFTCDDGSGYRAGSNHTKDNRAVIATATE